MRAAARRFGRDVHCHRQFLMVEALPGVSLQQTLGQLDKSERLAAIGWLTRGGPFWDDLRRHGAGDWLEYRGEVVTDTAVGEAAFRALHNNACGLVSVSPSAWEFSPIDVTWRRDADGSRDRGTSISNWWDVATLEDDLQTADPPIVSWDVLCDVATRRFAALRFAGDCFTPTAGLPFAVSAAERHYSAVRHSEPARPRLRQQRATDCRRPRYLPNLLHGRERVVLRFFGEGEARLSRQTDVPASEPAPRVSVLPVARQDASPRTTHALHVVRETRRAGLRRVRWPQDHEAVRQ